MGSLLFSASPALAQCSYYSRLPSVEQCTRESVKSPRAQREGYPLSGIRAWCERWQPQCVGARVEGDQKKKKN